jgi:hypothetical protein
MLRGSPKTALALYVELKRRADRRGHVRISNERLARAVHVQDRHTVCAAAHLLLEAGLIELPVRTYDRQGYVDGLDYALRVEAAYGANVRQQELPLKSSTTNSSAPCAPPPRPLTPATMKFTQMATWEVTNEHLAAKARGEDVPDNAPDVAQAVRAWLTDHGAAAAETDIRAALDHVEHQRRRQRLLPLIGVVARGDRQTAPHTRQTVARATRGGASDLSTAAAWARYLAAKEALEDPVARAAADERAAAVCRAAQAAARAAR